MPYTGDFENAALTAMVKKEAPSGWQPSFVGLAKQAAAVTFTAATTVLTKAAHGYAEKDLVELKAATVGASELVVGRLYYVKVVSTEKIELFDVYALTGTAVTVEGATAVELTKIEEATGATYARVASAWAAAANRRSKSSAAYEVKADAGQVVDYVVYFTAGTAGTAGQVACLSKVTKETFASAGVFKVEEGVLDLRAAA